MGLDRICKRRAHGAAAGIVVIVLLMMAGGAGGSTVLEDDFNSYTDGDLNGQGSWSGDSVPQVQGTTTYEGAKGIRMDGAVVGSLPMIKTGMQLADGKITFYIKRSSNNAVGQFGFGLMDSASNPVIHVRMLGRWSSFQYQDPSNQPIDYYDIQTYNTNTWYSVEIEWRSSDNKARYRINGGTWTDWLNRVRTTTPDRVYFYQGTATTGDTAYIDYIAENPIGQGEYSKKITIDHTKIDSDLTDFPLLVRLNSSNFDFSKARSDGYDIRFTLTMSHLSCNFIFQFNQL